MEEAPFVLLRGAGGGPTDYTPNRKPAEAVSPSKASFEQFKRTPSITNLSSPHLKKCFPAEHISSIEQRLHTSVDCLDILLSQYTALLSSLNHHQLQLLVNYATASVAKIEPLGDLPVAVIYIGFSYDSEAEQYEPPPFFQRLANELRNTTTPYCAVLRASEHQSSTMRDLVSFITSQLTRASRDTSKRIRDLDGFCKWYLQRLSNTNNDTLQSATAAANQKPPVVIAIEQIERFPPSIVETLVYALSRRRREFDVPFVVFVGISTTLDRVLRHYFSHTVTLSLSIGLSVTLCEANLSQCLDAILRSFILQMPPSGIMLGANALHVLIDHALVNAGGGGGLARWAYDVLRAAIGHHYGNAPLGFLASANGHSAVPLTREHLHYIRKLPSVRAYCRSVSTVDTAAVASDDTALRAKVPDWLRMLRLNRRGWCAALACVDVLFSELPADIAEAVARRAGAEYSAPIAFHRIVRDVLAAGQSPRAAPVVRAAVEVFRGTRLPLDVVKTVVGKWLGMMPINKANTGSEIMDSAESTSDEDTQMPASRADRLDSPTKSVNSADVSKDDETDFAELFTLHVAAFKAIQRQLEDLKNSEDIEIVPLPASLRSHSVDVDIEAERRWLAPSERGMLAAMPLSTSTVGFLAEQTSASAPRRVRVVSANLMSIFVDALCAFVDDLLCSPRQWLLHEVIVFDDAVLLRQALCPDHLPAIRKALSTPDEVIRGVLGFAPDAAAEDAVSTAPLLPRVPDVCAAFRALEMLALPSGKPHDADQEEAAKCTTAKGAARSYTGRMRYVKASKWFALFAEALGVKEANEMKPLKERFARVLIELKMLGVVSETGRHDTIVVEDVWCDLGVTAARVSAAAADM